ncbi:hypothetical protein C8R47DRAFT_1136575, partial [Mycena vitilis]
MSLNEENTVASFLTRHPALKSVEIMHFGGSGFWPSTSACIPLLNLERIRASPRPLLSIIARGLNEVRLEWFEKDPVELFLSILGPMTWREIPFVYSRFCWGDQCAEIADSMSRNVPHTKTTYMEVYAPDRPVREGIIAQLMKSLPRFTELECLGIQTKGDGRGAWGANDEITVQGLGNIRNVSFE